jgi:hypothetical protein
MARLRENLEQNENEYDLGVITGTSDGDVGIEHGALLMDYADAALGDDIQRLNIAREIVIATLGEEACGDAAGVISTFNAIDRVADATGIPVEEWKLESSEDFRASLGIEKFKELHLD